MIRHDGRVLDASGVAVGTVRARFDIDRVTFVAVDDRHRYQSEHEHIRHAERAVLLRTKVSERDVVILRARLAAVQSQIARLTAEQESADAPRLREILEHDGPKLRAELDAIASEMGDK